jgi:hypothetical protein
MSMRVPFVAARYDPAIGRYRSVLALQPERGYRVQQTTAGKELDLTSTKAPPLFGLTLCPFSIRARSHTATSPANLLNSRTWVSRSADHLLTISSIVLPLSIEGGGTVTMGVMELAAGAFGFVNATRAISITM